MGYEKTHQVETPGQFSVRGGIVDIFDLTGSTTKKKMVVLCVA